MINDLIPALRVGRGGACSRSTSYYTSVVTNNNHMLLTSLSVLCPPGGQSRIDRHSTAPLFYQIVMIPLFTWHLRPSKIYNGQPEYLCALLLYVILTNFLLKVHWRSYFFDNDAYAFASTRHNFFHDDARDSTSTTSRCFSTTSDTTAYRFVAATWYRFSSTRTCPEPLCLSKVTFPPMSPCRICRLIKYVCHHGVLVSDVDRVERFRLTLRLFDDVSTTSWFTFSIPTSKFSMTRRNFQSVLSVLFLFSIKSSC